MGLLGRVQLGISLEDVAGPAVLHEVKAGRMTPAAEVVMNERRFSIRFIRVFYVAVDNKP